VIGNDDKNNNERLEPLKASGIQNHTTSVSFGTVMDRNSLPELEFRNDGQTLTQLNDNPYAVKGFHEPE
jgi:hypothetical protein